MPINKKTHSNEIDFSEITEILLKNVNKIIFITIITTIIVMAFYLYDSKNYTDKPLFFAESKIEANSIFNEYEYNAYNSLVNSLINKKKFTSTPDPNDTNNKLGKMNLYTKDLVNLQSYSFFESYNFETIDRIYLYGLFIEKIRQNAVLEDGIKKFNLVKKNNYQNKIDYEKAVKKLASSIIIEDTATNTENNLFHAIKFKTTNKEDWENFLNYIEKTANKEIQNYLNKKNEYFIIDLQRIISYMTEDIEFELLNDSNDEKTITELKSIRNQISKNRYIERLNDLFYRTPISNLDNFTAAKIKIKETTYEDISKKAYPIEKVIFLSFILGIILGIIFVLISNRFQERG